MKLKNIDVSSELKKVEEYLDSHKNLSSEVVTLIRMLMMIISLMMNFFGANSKNSGKPPSQDPFRKKENSNKTGKKVGAQKGHVGTTLQLVDKPDEVVKLKINPAILPKDRTYTELTSQEDKNLISK